MIPVSIVRFFETVREGFKYISTAVRHSSRRNLKAKEIRNR